MMYCILCNYLSYNKVNVQKYYPMFYLLNAILLVSVKNVHISRHIVVFGTFLCARMEKTINWWLISRPTYSKHIHTLIQNSELVHSFGIVFYFQAKSSYTMTIICFDMIMMDNVKHIKCRWCIISKYFGEQVLRTYIVKYTK